MDVKRFLASGLLLCGALVCAAAEQGQPGGPAVEASRAVAVDNAAARLGRSLNSYASVAKVVAPSVVSVFSKRMVKNNDPELLRHLLKDPTLSHLLGADAEDPESMHRVTSLGSGVIVSTNGYILTNNHVVDGAEQIEVSMLDGSHKLEASVVGRDDLTDIAVLKIQTNNAPALGFGNSDKLKVGDVVLAVGNPFDVGQTVTMGIVSAVKRAGLGLEGCDDFIQTDAAINPGSSGGALVDAEGRLVGINTAILSGSGGNQGIGFAIPSNLVRKIMDQLIKNGKVVRGFLGVSLQDLTPKLAKAFKVPGGATGAVITEVIPGDPAAEAGLKTGDVVVEMGSHNVKDSASLRSEIANTTPGRRVPLRVLREGAVETISATVLERRPPEPLRLAVKRPRKGFAQQQALSGLSVTEIDTMVRIHLQIPDHVKGALVVKVDPNSAAYEAGLRVGDVIQEIDHTPVRTAEQASKVIKGFRRKQALVLAWSADGSHFIAVDAGEAG